MATRIATLGASAADLADLATSFPGIDTVAVADADHDTVVFVFDRELDTPVAEAVAELYAPLAGAPVVVVADRAESGVGDVPAGATDVLTRAELGRPMPAVRLHNWFRWARLEAEHGRAADERKAAVHENSDFVRLLSHDVRGALSTIGLACDVLKMSSDDAARDKCVSTIERALARTGVLLDEAGELVAIETGRTPMNPSACDLREVAVGVHERIAEAAAAANVAIDVQIPLEPVMALVDRVHLTTALARLLERIFVYAAGNAVALAVAIEQGRATVGIAVNGVDIAADQAARVFAKAWRGPNGTGALEPAGAMVRVVAEKLGGGVVVECAGSRLLLTVLLPAAE